MTHSARLVAALAALIWSLDTPAQTVTEALRVTPSSIRFLHHPARVPLVEARLPIVRASIGEHQVNLVLDTGASGVILFDETVRRLALSRRQVSVRVDVGVGPALRVLEATRIDALLLKKGTTTRAVLHDLDALVVPRGPAIPGIVTHGVLGLGAFAPILLTLDLGAGVVELATGQLPEADGRTILPLRRSDASILARCAGKDVRFLIDSGFDGGVLLPRLFEKHFDFRAAPVRSGGVATGGSSADRRSARLSGSLELGRYTLVEPVVDIVPNAVAAIIGAETLRHFRVTIDQRGRSIRFARGGKLRIDTPPLRRWGFETKVRDGSCMVVYVDPSSPAHRAGLRPGDDILEAGGVVTDGLTPIVWDRLQRTSGNDDGLSMLIGRDDLIFRTSIRLQTLVQ